MNSKAQAKTQNISSETYVMDSNEGTQQQRLGEQDKPLGYLIKVDVG